LILGRGQGIRGKGALMLALFAGVFFREGKKQTISFHKRKISKKKLEIVIEKEFLHRRCKNFTILCRIQLENISKFVKKMHVGVANDSPSLEKNPPLLQSELSVSRSRVM